ncbi:hypothetical protein [Rhizobium sp. HT1-10]|uniref:hypothetical protein n=1 Tax=Rhizobium sp. HT1-10 TaxID=3111638 RepID=UPI003C2ABF67
MGGSFNYTASAEKRNAENVLFMDSQALAGQFTANWQSRLTASREFSPAEKPAD